jgi:hypothetical protein
MSDDVTGRIDHGWLPWSIACDETGTLGEAFFEEAPEHALQSRGDFVHHTPRDVSVTDPSLSAFFSFLA